jgi:type IV fimbrial biogenesis protein FimT
MNPRRAGFTLIELLIVVAMISIMLVIAVPSFTSFISNYRATSAINDILQGVTLTRNEALKRGRRVTMAPISADWRNGWIIFIDSTSGGNNNQSWDTGEEIIFQHDKLPSSITVAGPGATLVPFLDSGNGRSYVAFDGTGYPRTALGGLSSVSNGIAIKDTTGSSINIRTLCLATMGRPRIVKTVDACTSG